MRDAIVLVTGAAQGIGAAVVGTLVARGAVVAAVDRDATRLHATAAELDPGGRVAPFVADVADRRAIEAVVAAVEHDIGPIDGLAHAAGILRMGPIATFADEDWDAVFRVNLGGLRNTARAVAARMLPRRRGAIVSVASNAAAVPRVAMSAYAASKAAAVMFTRCLALELAPHVRCNVVSPGSTDTAMQRAYWDDTVGPQQVLDGSLAAYRLGIPLRRIAEPSDIAAAVVFLLSEEARHITMANLCVDGGATLGAST